MRLRQATTSLCFRHCVNLLETHGEARARVLDNCLFMFPRYTSTLMNLPWRLLDNPERNFFMRSTASPPWCCCPAVRLALLFFKLVSVSIMNRVRELLYSEQGLNSSRKRRPPHFIVLVRKFCLHDTYNIF